jgi:hypothetical protein
MIYFTTIISRRQTIIKTVIGKRNERIVTAFSRTENKND